MWRRCGNGPTLMLRACMGIDLSGFKLCMAEPLRYHCQIHPFLVKMLTTAANESMIPVHDRMPIILERDELVEWTTNREWAVNHLNKKPCQLDIKTEFEQMSLF